MIITKTQIGEIYSTCRNAGIFVSPLKVVVTKDDLVHTEYLFENIKTFVDALKKLDGFVFENAMNGQIALKKGEIYYSFQISPVGEIFDRMLDIS